MKNSKILAILVLALGLPIFEGKVSGTTGMGTAFTYQGRLIDTNTVADGLYDLQFILYDSPEDGNQIGSMLNASEVDVTDGYFTVLLDFGSGVFNGDGRWLEIGVRPGELEDPNLYTSLSPRQEVTPAPYAIYAKTAGATINPDSDWIISGSNMYSGVSGNVGIGTTIPVQRLDVSGAANLNSGISGGVALYVNGSEALWYNGTYFSWGFGGTANYFIDNVGIGTTIPARPLSFSDTYGDKISIWGQTPDGNCVGFGNQAAKLQIYTDGPHADIVFGYGKSANLTETMRIKGTGNVGIGTANPSALLHIETGATGDLIIGKRRDTGSEIKLGFHQPSGYAALQSTAGNNVLLLNPDSGNVGIGTTAPANKLHCSGNGAYSYSGAAPTGDAYNIILEAPASGTGMFGGIKFNNTGNSQDRVAYIGAINENWANRDLTLVFGTDGGGLRTEKMRITGNGNVGIGTTTPARKLHISNVMRLQPTTEPSSPAEGDIYMDGKTHKLMVYDGTTWQACW